jgi:hypothetical protein
MSVTPLKMTTAVIAPQWLSTAHENLDLLEFQRP